MSSDKSDKIYLVVLRHGDCRDDKLSEYGVEQINLTAAILKDIGVEPDIVITSPTGRTRETTRILCQHFNQVAQMQEKDLFFCESETMDEINGLLSGIPNDHKAIILSGHAETVNSFTYHALNRQDGLKLISMIEVEKFDAFLSGNADYMRTSASTGDALILEAKRKDNQNLVDAKWDLHGYIRKGKFYSADKINFVLNLPVEKMDMEKDFPILTFKRK